MSTCHRSTRVDMGQKTARLSWLSLPQDHSPPSSVTAIVEDCRKGRLGHGDEEDKLVLVRGRQDIRFK